MEIKYSHRLLRSPLTLTLPEVTASDLKPAFRVKRHTKTTIIYSYNNKLWAEYPYATLREIIRDVKSVGKPLPEGVKKADLTEELGEMLADKLVCDNVLFFEVFEPRFYYCSHDHCIRECHEPNEVSMVSPRRFFRADEASLAQEYADMINRMIFSVSVKQIFQTPEVEVLDQSTVNLPTGAIDITHAKSKNYDLCRANLD